MGAGATGAWWVEGGASRTAGAVDSAAFFAGAAHAIRLVERCAARLLHPGGVVGCEHADVQWQAAPAVFAGTDAWADIRDRQDLAGKPRFVTARRAGDAA